MKSAPEFGCPLNARKGWKLRQKGFAIESPPKFNDLSTIPSRFDGWWHGGKISSLAHTDYAHKGVIGEADRASKITLTAIKLNTPTGDKQ